MGPLVLDHTELVVATDALEGYCPVCNDFTVDCIEPDADGCFCPCCKTTNVMSIDIAVAIGLIEVADGGLYWN